MLHIIACRLIVFNRGVAKRMQHFVQHDTTLLHARVQQSTTKLHGMAKRVQHHTTSRTTKEMSYNICLVKQSDRDQTSYNKIQHDTT